MDDATKENIQKVIGNVVRVAVSNKNLPDDEVNKRISVFAKPFSGKLDDNNNGFFTPTMMYGVGAVALLALGALAFVLIRRRKQQEQEEVEFEEEFPFTPSLDIPDLSSLEDDTDEAMVRKQLEKLARSNPDEFVVLLRTWLAED